MIDKALDIWDADGNLCDAVRNIKDLYRGADLLAKSCEDQRIQNLAAQVRNPRLRLYLETLQDRLLNIAVRYNRCSLTMSRAKIFGIIASHWYWQRQKPRPVSSAGRSKGERRVARERAYKELLVRQMTTNLQLRQVQMMLANFDEVCRQVESALDNVFRASSLVEAINSQLRLFQQVKKSLSRDFLSLITLYWNMHPFSDGKRKKPLAFPDARHPGASRNLARQAARLVAQSFFVSVLPHFREAGRYSVPLPSHCLSIELAVTLA